MFEQEPGERGGENPGAFKLGPPGGSAAVLHRSAGIAHDVKADIGFLHVAFDAKPVVRA